MTKNLGIGNSHKVPKLIEELFMFEYLCSIYLMFYYISVNKGYESKRNS